MNDWICLLGIQIQNYVFLKKSSNYSRTSGLDQRTGPEFWSRNRVLRPELCSVLWCGSK